MSSNEKKVHHSLPIPIERRRRSDSGSDSSSDSSVSPASPLPTPTSGTLPRIAPISPSTSPILSYFLSQSPKSSPSATFPFRRGMSGALFEDEDVFEPEKPQERAAGLLRRLSLGGNMARPPVPVLKPINTAVAAQGHAVRSTTPPGMKAGMDPATPTRKARRANTIAPGTTRPPRAPSPMGERILKGHFDGFN
ncbi:hypothetical protein C8Q80DRAFT_1269525 [Daedaleopsis nitida]|nr:hypothetical protein C8Q80DRAFT_1269525 [Daedaleopsis nitida]